MTPVERLVQRLRPLGMYLPSGYQFHRTYAGRVQRAQGAWSWFITDRDGREIVGSQYPVAALLRAEALCLHGSASGIAEVDPTCLAN